MRALVAASRARRRDRRVYLRSHPLLFALLCATRHRPVLRLGRTVLVQGTDAYREALTRVPLDRTAVGTTGGAVDRLTGGGQLFDQDGRSHRDARRAAATGLGSPGVAELRPRGQELLRGRIEAAAAIGRIELVGLAQELAGFAAAALTGSSAEPRALARAACAVAALGARDQLPGLPTLPGLRGRRGEAMDAALAALTALLPRPDRVVLAVASVTTTVAALPRAAAWCADADCWPGSPAEASAFAAELLRLTAPSPLLPRVAGADAALAGARLRAGDRLLLVARHAALAHRADADAAADAAAERQLVFGAGPHACPGAALARALTADFLLALAPYRPVVLSRTIDRRAALPGYRSVVVRLHAFEREAAACG